jgi:protease II
MLPEWKLTNPKALPFPCGYYNNPLPAFVVHPQLGPKGQKGAKGLLITAYGAYGMPTHVGYLIQRWKPLLLRGWIIAAVMVPGSGDHDTKWIRSGQRLNRIHAIEQFTDSVRSLQEEHGISPMSTALYGRSAGGLLVSSVAIRTPGLVGSLYVESPYIDILRTMTNPQLPLTTLETSEFGTSPTDLIATAEWSPLEHIPEEGIPELFVVARTDLQDLEVLPYEVVKFIKRLRGPLDKNKLVYIHSDRGHFTTDIKSRAEDLALLDSMESSGVRIKNIGYRYKMPNGSMSKNNSRNNKKNSRNNKKNSRNNKTEGGRRRRSVTRGRKATRKAGRKH